MGGEKNESAVAFRTNYLLRQTIIVAIISFAVYGSMHIFVDFKGQLIAIINNYVTALIFVGILFIANKGYHELAKYLSIIMIDVGFIIPVFICYGKTPAIHYYFLVFAMAPLALWSLEKKSLTTIYFVVNISLFLFVERYSELINPILSFPEVLVTPVQISSMVVPFLMLLLSLRSYYESTEKKNAEILDKKDKLAILNNELEEANATKDKFFSIIAHDLKNPLHTLMGFSDMLDTDFDKLDTEEQKKQISFINRSGKDLYNLLESLLQWSSAQTKSIPFEPKTLNIADLSSSSLNLLTPMALKKNISLHNNITSELEVYADMAMVNTILQNLLVNALKFTNDGGNIYIDTTTDSDFAYITIKDDGVGMTKEDQEQIFRIDNSYTRMGTSGEKGSGLGLNICQEFALINGGKIIVESELNNGSAFTFSLPLTRSSHSSRSL